MHRSIVWCLVLVSGATACATEEVDSGDGVTAQVEEGILADCTYTIKRDTITVVKGEGGADPALELDVDTSVDHDGTSSTVNFGGTIKSGASFTTDATIFINTVPSGTFVVHDWGIDATEFDTFDADDHGTGGGQLAFTCSGSSTSSDTDQVSLGNATISVRVKASW